MLQAFHLLNLLPNHRKRKVFSPSTSTTESLKEEGWGKYPDGEGRFYYFNVNTGATSWTPPEGWVDEEPPAPAATSSSSTSVTPSKSTTEILKEEGWGKYPDGEGRFYYFNVNTGATSWTAPDGWVDEEPPAPAATLS